MSKIGNFFNQDVGKLLKADIGSAAAKVLKADVGDIVKGTGKVLKYDLSDLFVGDANNADATATVSEDNATPKPTAAATPATPIAASTPTASAATATIATTAAPPRAKLTPELVNRQTRAMPTGSSLAQLMPLVVGSFSRPANQAQGNIANDPVSLSYSSDHEALTLSLEACWDNDEAMEKMQRRLTTLENVRMGDDGDWAAGIDQSGVIFLWLREQYYFEIVSPRGVSATARFLADFPY